MGKVIFKMILWTVATVFVLGAPLHTTVFGYGGGEGGETQDIIGSRSLGGPPPRWDDENIEPEFRIPDFVKNPPVEKRDPWGAKIKPKHWTDKQWKEYKKKRNRIFRHEQKKAFGEMDKANRNHTIAKGTGYAATGAGAVIGLVAAPAVAPTIVIISIIGDGAATTAGSLAEGKSVKESLKDGAKKSVSSAILSKMSTGKQGVDAVTGVVGGFMYDNTESSDKQPVNHLPPPDFTTPGGHNIYK
ncbi:MAG: hypothetical protein L3J69_01045 [Desulfobacula sp.]|nr:hypothetical protein [Desulfobacula sp.]